MGAGQSCSSASRTVRASTASMAAAGVVVGQALQCGRGEMRCNPSKPSGFLGSSLDFCVDLVCTLGSMKGICLDSFKLICLLRYAVST